MKKIILSILVLALFGLPGLSFAQTADSGVDIHIDKDGNFTATNAKITQFIGNTIMAKVWWGPSAIRFTAKTEGAEITKKYGSKMTVSEMKVGDLISVKGTLESSVDTISIRATMVKNWSDENGSGEFSGIIQGAAPGARGFLMKTDAGEVITLSVDNNTRMQKGTRMVGLGDIVPGDKVERASGPYNFGSKVLSVESMTVYLDLNQFLPRNFQGTLKTLSGTSLPTTMTITVDGKNYTVKLADTCSVMNTKRAATSLSRFVIGDTVRFFGAPMEADPSIVNAIVVRNISL